MRAKFGSMKFYVTSNSSGFGFLTQRSPRGAKLKCHTVQCLAAAGYAFSPHSFTTEHALGGRGGSFAKKLDSDSGNWILYFST